MTISNVSNLEPIIEQLKTAQSSSQTTKESFTKIFEDALDNANQTESIAKNDELLIATGQTDDLHTIMIDAAKAELALSTLVQIRNKALDAYNDIMKMTL